MLDSMLRRPREALGALRGSERSIWWASFAISLSLSLCWIVATPIFAAADEPAHAIRAASVARLEFLGHADPAFKDELVVDAPRGYRKTQKAISCYVFGPTIPASCARIWNDTDIVPLPTASGRHPPAYYFVAGLPSLVLQSSKSIYLMRLVSALITAAFVAMSIASLRRVRDARAASLGLAVALTPLLWFVSGTVNPSTSEIAAGVGLWACGGVLALQARDRAEPVLVRRVGIAVIVLALSRHLGPGWVIVILAVLAVVAGRAGIARIAADRSARLWGLAAAVAGASTVIWDVAVHPIEPRASDMMHVTMLDAAWTSLRDSFNRYKEFAGWFGWLDTPPTATMTTLFTTALVALTVAAFVMGRRKLAWLAVVVAIGTVFAPVVFEAFEAHNLGYFWQSRYTLPLAVGAPILLGLSLAERPRPNTRAIGIVVVGVALLAVAVQVLGFAQALMRNTVGYYGGWNDFLFHPIWHPPFPPWFLFGSAIVAVLALTYWLVGWSRSDSAAADAPTGADAAPAAAVT